MKKETIMKKINSMSTKLEYLDSHGYKSIYALCELFDKKKYNSTVYRECDSEILKSEYVIPGYENVGIVFQGPLDKNNDFTINTVKLLRKIYPDITIVVSTWIGDITDEERIELQYAKCVILESQSMGGEDKGKGQKIGHLNNQLLSSKVGLEYLEKNNIEYALKIRTDLRIYKIDFIPYFMNLLELFGKERIINVAFSNSLISVPYHMSDFIWFGAVNKVLQVYSAPFRGDDQLKYIRDYINKGKFPRHEEIVQVMKQKTEIREYKWYDGLELDEEFFVAYHEESYISYYYDKKKSGKNLLESYHDFLKREIIIVDDKDVLAFWNKSLYSAVQSNYALSINRRLSHSKWIEILLRDKSYDDIGKYN